MKKTLIVYYTKTGNNKFVAERMSKLIDSDLEEITPERNNSILLFISSWLKISTSIKSLSSDLNNYEKIILFSPIWFGSLISPIRGFVKKYKDDIKEFVFITVCGGGEEDKDTKFGYEGVFKEMRKLFPSKEVSCYEISTKGVESKDLSSSGEPLISQDVFIGNIKDRFDEIVEIVK
jgi:flavodoxin